MHRTKGRWRLLAAACLVVPAAFGARPYPEVEVDYEVQRAPDSDAYYIVGKSGVPGPDNEGLTANAGFVLTKEGVVVFDTLGTPALGWEMLREIRQRTDQPVKYVVLSHYHADHVYGTQAFKDHTDAQIIAQARAFQYIESENARNRLLQRQGALYPWVDEETRLVPPDKTFEDRYQFELGEKTFTIIHTGPAHAPDDSMLIVQPSGVVFSSDVVFLGRLPFIAGNADTKHWLAALDRVKELNPRFIIPGHGQATDDAAEAIAFTRGYLQFLRTNMGQAAENLLTFDEAYEQTDWSRYEDVPTFDAANRGNAHNVFLEMQQSLF